MTDLNILDRTLNRIAKDPEDWKQHSWCQCFAGHMLREVGYTSSQVRTIGERPHRDPATGEWNLDRNRIALHAQEFGGLTDEEAGVLFDGDNTYEMLESMVSDIKGGTLQEWEKYAAEAGILDAFPAPRGTNV